MDIQVQMASAYLQALNPEQRRAVEHGAEGGLAAPPLLVIAGAGSGKTNTLAHRVAHLIVQGADPRRILLMTFSRRAALEMTRRVERIARKVMGDNAVALYVPKRFAHGYQVLEDATETSYQVGEFYTPEAEGGLRYDDPALGLSWPLPVTEISEKDGAWALLADVEDEVKRRMAAGVEPVAAA